MIHRKRVQRLWREEGLRVPKRRASAAGSLDFPRFDGVLYLTLV